jgi:hypothetical protein
MAETNTLEFPAASPLCTLKQRVGLTDIQVVYSRPGVKSRRIFGTLVPYGKLWRTGANQATRISFSTPIKLNGTEIAAGNYALLTIPGKDEWTIIINKEAEQIGPFKHDESKDIAKFQTKTSQLHDTVSTFTIDFDELNDESAMLNLIWDKTKVPIKVEVAFVDELVPRVEAVMASGEKQKPYFQAGLFFFNHNRNLEKAKEWVDAAIAEREIYPFVFVKAKILAKLNDTQGAKAVAKQANEMALKANDTGFAGLIDDFVAGLK